MTNYAEVDHYFTEQFISEKTFLKELLANNSKHGLPPHDVSPSQGKFLALLTKIAKAKRILEIGTLGGYSTLWFAEALPTDGRIITLEYSNLHAKVANENFKNSPFQQKIDLIEGAASASLQHLIDENVEPFDLIFIDADKENNPVYLDLSLKLAKIGTIIIGDNIVRDGAVIDKYSQDKRVIGIQAFLKALADSPYLDSTALETVGMKGYDGFSLSIVHSIPS